MRRRRPRGLRPDEKDLWSKYTTGVSAAPKPAAEAADPPDEAPISPPPRHLPKFKVGEKVPPRSSVALTVAKGPMDEPPRMDRKTYQRLKKGQVAPEARIDLHGMTVADAHDALAKFIFRAQSKGLRLVLVITGKGDKGDVGLLPVARGVLRRQVPEWLRLPPVATVVMDVTTANRRHGGDGAFYVYLRRLR